MLDHSGRYSLLCSPLNVSALGREIAAAEAAEMTFWRVWCVNCGNWASNVTAGEMMKESGNFAIQRDTYLEMWAMVDLAQGRLLDDFEAVATTPRIHPTLSLSWRECWSQTQVAPEQS